MPWSEQSFMANGLKLVAKVWGKPTGLPVLALHGWLDNASSFDHLAAYLPDSRVVALDLAGHGLSQHRSADAGYSIWDDIAEIYEVLHQLQWSRCVLVGHSRGAIISTLFASAFPDKVAGLGLVEGIWPHPVDPAQAPKQLAKSVLENRKLGLASQSCYQSREDAIVARCNGIFPLREDAATRFVERGLYWDGRVYRWRADPRLMTASPFKLNQAHVDAFVQGLSMPVQLAVGDQGLPKMQPGLSAAVDGFPNIQLCEFTGGHHLHMEAAAQPIAEWFQRGVLTTV